MLPACRTNGEGCPIPTFDLVPSDVEGFMDALWEFQSAFHDCFARSEPRAHFFDYMVGQFSKLERKSIEPMALHVEGGTIRGLQRFISDVHWDEDQMRWNYHQLVAEELGEPDGVLMFDETGFVKKGKDSVGVARQYCGTLGKVELTFRTLFPGSMMVFRGVSLKHVCTDHREPLQSVSRGSFLMSSRHHTHAVPREAASVCRRSAAYPPHNDLFPSV
jgi:hypothetical protein